MLKKINNKLLLQIIRFSIVGGIATLIDFAVLYILKEFLGFHPILANTLSFTVSVIYNYIASIHWVFDVDKEKNKKKQFALFVIFSIIGLLINNAIMWICIVKYRIHYLIGKVLATIIVMIFNFVTRKKFLE